MEEILEEVYGAPINVSFKWFLMLQLDIPQTL